MWKVCQNISQVSVSFVVSLCDSFSAASPIITCLLLCPKYGIHCLLLILLPSAKNLHMVCLLTEWVTPPADSRLAFKRREWSRGSEKSAIVKTTVIESLCVVLSCERERRTFTQWIILCLCRLSFGYQGRRPGSESQQTRVSLTPEKKTTERKVLFASKPAFPLIFFLCCSFLKIII